MYTISDQLIKTEKIELLDCTLRDGSYSVDFQFEEDFVVDLLERINETPICKVEIGHGFGVEAEKSGIRSCNIDHYKWSEIACSVLTEKSWGMFAQPEFTQLDTVAKLCDRGMSFVRVGMEPDRVPENIEYIQQATDVCEQVYLNLMKSSATPVNDLLSLLDGVSPSIAGLYIVDSYGAMLPRDVHEYVNAVKKHFSVIGFHGHNNLGMANVNSIAAIEAGATIVDGTLNGIGRGAGNAEIESLAGLLTVLDTDRFDYKKLAKLAELCRVNMAAIPEDREMQVLGSVIGIHSGYFSLVEELSAEYDTDPAHIMEVAVDIAAQSPSKADMRAAARRIADRSEMRSNSHSGQPTLGGTR
ncbi:4-hydroxy 2-oxovalerate aldolase [Actinopolyspora xinjiangensis]|uniref:4-hydroxy 2-oxovalerate aldolase n=1 Tax=Actinopolyspora xinjiangensis TaxID=405564 RepID=A0A1H0WY95_9ACTN|nr:hypothetical protein [Actinopolyspora xinjiangensis]SDP95693.1 4-hydroxy 2-oxovalerate aldolase [Actinopolyspora xinjiangensis]